MKRLIFIVALVMVALWVLRAERRVRVVPPATQAPPAARPLLVDEFKRGPKVRAPKPARRTLDEVRQALHEAHDELRHAVDEAKDEFQQAIDEVREEVRHAVDEVHSVSVSCDDDDTPCPARPPVATAPPAAPAPPAPPAAVVMPDGHPGQESPHFVGKHAGISTEVEADLPEWGATPTNQPPNGKVDGLICSDKQRAEADVRNKLREAVAEWLDPDVPRGWTRPDSVYNSLIQTIDFEPVDRPYGTMYVAHLKFDASPGRRASLVAVYNRELVIRRLVKLGGSLGFILICLAAVSGYIRADEATKGYYTKRLRMLAAAGVGAAGVLIYQMLARA
jgi:hypothetical protein